MVLMLTTSPWAHAIDFNRIVVFGGSLSDPGNFFALTGQAISPPYSALDSVVASVAALPGVEIARLDVYDKVNEIIANPAAFGLTEVSASCITPDIRPFTCRKPDRYFFWDGVHPTKAVHTIFAQEAAQILDVPASHSKSRRFVSTASH
jgi:phospholipase/lecithinase/hemolysin